jgi:hypothetical protein
MLCFFKGYISAESIPVLCLLWEQTSFISPIALFLLGLHFSRINPLCFVFYGNKLALLVPMLCFFKGYNTAAMQHKHQSKNYNSEGPADPQIQI